MEINVEKGLIGAAVLGALVLFAPIAKHSKAFVNCVKNSEDAIVKLIGVEFLDKDGKPGFLGVLLLSTTSTAVTSPTY